MCVCTHVRSEPIEERASSSCRWQNKCFVNWHLNFAANGLHFTAVNWQSEQLNYSNLVVHVVKGFTSLWHTYYAVRTHLANVYKAVKDT